MEPNSIHHAESNHDMDSSISSLITSFGQLEINDTDEPINRLPNELMQLILAKLGLDCDVKKLVQLKLVSIRWRTVVEDYCGLKKSLIVYLYQATTPTDDSGSNLARVEERFFKLVKLKDFTRLFLSNQIASERLSSLLNLFPNIVQLSIRCYDPVHVHDLTVYINSLNFLTVLDLDGPFVPSPPHLAPTLSKLNHFSFDTSDPSTMRGDHYQLVSHLGHGCARVYFGQYTQFVYYNIVQWRKINPHWLANLTHLLMNICESPQIIPQVPVLKIMKPEFVYFQDSTYSDKTPRPSKSEECVHVVHFLSKYSNSLKHLNLNFMAWNLPVELTSTLIATLGKLTNLTELELWNIGIDSFVLQKEAQQHGLSALSSVLKCKLFVTGGRSATGFQFVTVLSVIFPNLTNLNLTIGSQFLCERWFHSEIMQNLDRFSDLCYHDIRFA